MRGTVDAQMAMLSTLSAEDLIGAGHPIRRIRVVVEEEEEEVLGMSKPLRVRRLTDREGRELQRIVRRGSGSSDGSVVRWRRALVVLASAGGNTVPVIARLAATSQDRVREMIHRFNELGMASLDPRWAGGRPRRITTDDEEFIVKAATARPEAVGLAFTR